MVAPPQFPGPPSSVIQEINIPSRFNPIIPPTTPQDSYIDGYTDIYGTYPISPDQYQSLYQDLYGNSLPDPVSLVSGLSGLAYFSTKGDPKLPSLVEEIVNVTQFAFLNANVEIAGTLLVDGGINQTINTQTVNATLGPNVLAGLTTLGSLTVTPGPILLNGGSVGSLSTSPGDFMPDGSPTAGNTGRAADAGHVHPNFAYLSGYLDPAASIAESFPRDRASTNGSVSTTSLYLRAIPLAAGVQVNSITLSTGTTAGAGVTHGFYCLVDPNLIIRAVSADQTGGTTWTSTTTAYTLPVGSYVVPTSGAYYIGVSVTGSTPPNFAATSNLAGGVAALSPVLYGNAGAQSTPPTIGSTVASLNVGNGLNLYSYVS